MDRIGDGVLKSIREMSGSRAIGRIASSNFEVHLLYLQALQAKLAEIVIDRSGFSNSIVVGCCIEGQ
jgi:hypothetical protein